MKETESSCLNEFPFLRPEMKHVSLYTLQEPLFSARLHQNEGIPLNETEKSQLSEQCANFINAHRSLNTYPSVDPTALRDAMANLYGVSPDCVEPTCGSSQGISLIAQACFDKGTAVSVVEPSFSLYKSLCLIQGSNYRSVPLRTDNFEYDMEAVLKARTSDVIILCNPNNPTGSVLPVASIAQLAASSKGLIVVDEAYIEFCPELASSVSLVSKHKNVLVLRTLSKAWGLAGLRLGALVGHADLIKVFRALKPPYSVTGLSEHLGVFALQNWQQNFAAKIAHVQAQQSKMLATLKMIPGVVMAPSRANFVCFVHPKSYDLELELRSKHNILIRVYGQKNQKDHASYGMARASVWSDDANDVFMAVAQKVLGS
jgi:histidinol-phosphate aminotransferase